MTQTQKSDIAGRLFPFNTLENLSITITEEHFLSEIEDVMELPVNNYLKTPREIEIEFQYGINPRKIGTHDRKNGIGESSILNTDGYLNIQDLDITLSGFMEENY